MLYPDNFLYFIPLFPLSTSLETGIYPQTIESDLALIIKDTDLGMRKEKLVRIFQLQNNKSEAGTGGEKGLHLVYELISINKEQIKVSSELSKETIFKVFLPK